jgi:hypothetical protein
MIQVANMFVAIVSDTFRDDWQEGAPFAISYFRSRNRGKWSDERALYFEINRSVSIISNHPVRTNFGHFTPSCAVACGNMRCF